jgi:hypothetical protein
LQDWAKRQDELLRLARCQLFFIGGAPRSGTTWLQQILDCHPDVCCRGEALFWKHLAEPMQSMMAQRRQAIEAKNTGIFRHTGGFPLPAPDDTEFMIGTATLLALRQQTAGKAYAAVGEKTPENVFFFPRLKHLFPDAKFVGIARDPRDVLTSAWHFFHKPVPGEDDIGTKTAFIRSALGPLREGARAMMALAERHPADCKIVTYEALRRTPELITAELFRFLCVSDQDSIVNDCLTRTSFAAQTGGRPIGVEQRGSFFRKGVVGDWTATLTPAMSEIVAQELGWMFPYFGWTL